MYRIRPLTTLDVRSAKDIFHEVFDKGEWPEFNWIWRYRSKRESLGIFTREGDIMGFALILGHARNLKYICVHPMYQYKKLGTVLLTAILKNCVAIDKNLSLVPANDFVTAWYARHGFNKTTMFRASDNTLWAKMNFHTKRTRMNRLKLKRLSFIE